MEKKKKYKKFSFLPIKIVFLPASNLLLNWMMKTDWKDYKKIQELSAVCRIVIEKGDDGIGLNKTNYITDTVGYKKS